MNALMNATTTQTMTSKQIAVVVEKRHDNVKRTIENLADQAVIVRPQIEDEQFKDSMGRNRTESVYVVNERAMTKKTAPKHDYLVFKTKVRAKAVDQGDMTDARLKVLYCRYLMGTAPDWVLAIVDATPVVKKVDADDDSKLGIDEHKVAVERGIWTTNLILELLSEKPLDSDELRRLAVARGADIKTVKAQTGKLLGLSKIKCSIYSIYGEKSSGCGRIYCMPEHFTEAKAMAKQKAILSAKEKYKELIGLLSYRPITAIELGALLGRRAENVNVSIRPLVLLGLVEKVQIVRHDQRQGRKSNAYIIGSAA